MSGNEGKQTGLLDTRQPAKPQQPPRPEVTITRKPVATQEKPKEVKPEADMRQPGKPEEAITGLAIVSPVVSVGKLVEHMKLLQDLKGKLLSKEDWVSIKDKPFIKRSGWRKFALAFGISDEIIRAEKEPLKGDNYVWRIWVRTIAPNGRSAVGVGSCSTLEREFVHEEHDVYAIAHCVPLDAQILTRYGFKYFSELFIGEEVLAYSIYDDRCHWVPLMNVTVYDNLPMIRMLNKGFDIHCSPDHTWAINKRQLRKHSSLRELRRASDFTSECSLVLAAYSDEDKMPLSSREAAILGWLLTDGTIRSSKVHNKWGPYLRLHIDQSKSQYVTELRSLLDGIASEHISHRSFRTFPQGHTSALQQSHRFLIKSEFGNNLFQKARITDIVNLRELPEIVTYLTSDARKAMLGAMLKADGAKHGSTWIFGVKEPMIMEVFQILATLEGFAVGKLVDNGQGLFRQTLRRFRHLDAIKLRKKNVEPMPAWCPTTEYGTWIMRYHGQICITGNTRAKNRSISDLIGSGEVSAEEMKGEKS